MIILNSGVSLNGRYTTLSNTKSIIFFKSLPLLKILHTMPHVPNLTFSFFLSVSGGCFAVILRGVLTTSSSGTSTVRPFDCKGYKKTSHHQNGWLAKTKTITRTTIKFFQPKLTRLLLHGHII